MWVHQARAAQLSRTALAEGAVGPNDPGVKSAETAVAAANADAARVAVVHQQVTTPAPQVGCERMGIAWPRLRSSTCACRPASPCFWSMPQRTTSRLTASPTPIHGIFLLNYAGSGPVSRDKSATATQAQDPDSRRDYRQQSKAGLSEPNGVPTRAGQCNVPEHRSSGGRPGDRRPSGSNPESSAAETQKRRKRPESLYASR